MARQGEKSTKYTRRESFVQSLEKSNLTILEDSNETLSDYDLIMKCLEMQFFTKKIPKNSLQKVIKNFSLCEIKKSRVLFHQGSPGDFFYIVKEGQLELLINNQKIKTFSRGQHFGELALLHEAPRTGTVVALENTRVYALERKVFRKVINEANEMNFEENKKFIDHIQILCK